MLNIDLERFKALTDGSLSRREYCDQFLQLLVNSTGAAAGIIWDCSSVPYHSISQYSLTEPTSIPLTKNEHENLLANALKQVVCSTVSTSIEDPNDFPYLVLKPMRDDLERTLIVELLVSASVILEKREETFQVVEAACKIFSTKGVKANDTSGVRNDLGSSISLGEFSSFIRTIHGSIDQELTCRDIANEVRRMMNCDRVGVLLKKRGRFRMAAISGQISVNRRSNVVRLLEHLARKTLKTEKIFWYPADEEIPPQVSGLLDEYLVSSATRSLVILPIFETAAVLVDYSEMEDKRPTNVIGGIVFEHCSEQWNREDVSDSIDFIGQHGGDALRNANRHHALFLYPLWNLLGKSRLLTAPKMLPWTSLVLASTIVTMLVLFFMRVPFYVPAEGVLVPRDRMWVFSQVSGDVENVVVDNGSVVTKGETLLTLRNEELRMRIEETLGRISMLQQRKSLVEYSSFENLQDKSGANQAENATSIQAEIDSLSKQLGLLSKMETKLKVVSPSNGEVITWDVQRKLTGRTVNPSQLLMEIADSNAPWQLELDVIDRNAGHLLRGWQVGNSEGLKVKFSLVADPNQTFVGKVVGVGNAMRLNSENQQVISVRVEIEDEDKLKLKQAKSGVAAKIYCGYETSLGYLWFHEVPETIRRYVLFYISG